MSTPDIRRRSEKLPWNRFAYVFDDDSSIRASSVPLSVDRINAASNSTIIIERMLRNGRVNWRMRMLNKLSRKRPTGTM